MNESSCVFEIIDQTVKSSENRLSVKELCKTAGVSRSGYYAWVKAAPAREAAEEQDRMDFSLILEAYKVRGYKKGAESIYMNLLHMDPPVTMNLKKIRRLMKKFGLTCPVQKANAYRRMAKALKTSNVAENLLQREFESYGPRMVLLTPHDKNAIKIIVAKKVVGYVPAEECLSLKDILKKHEVKYISCFIGGGQYKLVSEDFTTVKNKVFRGKHIANHICICYNTSRQKDDSVHQAHKERAPEVLQYFRGSSSFTEKSTVWVRLPTIYSPSNHLHR